MKSAGECVRERESQLINWIKVFTVERGRRVAQEDRFWSGRK